MKEREKRVMRKMGRRREQDESLIERMNSSNGRVSQWELVVDS